MSRATIATNWGKHVYMHTHLYYHERSAMHHAYTRERSSMYVLAHTSTRKHTHARMRIYLRAKWSLLACHSHSNVKLPVSGTVYVASLSVLLHCVLIYKPFLWVNALCITGFTKWANRDGFQSQTRIRSLVSSWHTHTVLKNKIEEAQRLLNSNPLKGFSEKVVIIICVI